MINTWAYPNFDLAEVTVLPAKKIKVNKVWVAGMSEMLQEISFCRAPDVRRQSRQPAR